MTTRERIQRMYEHREADRIPILDSPWPTTIKRWHREGLPANLDYREYFDLDRVGSINVDISPRYEERIIEENEDYIIYTTEWGATLKEWKEATSTPEFLDFTIKSADLWKKAKERMIPAQERIDWSLLEREYRSWREKGYWIQANFWFGFDVTHSWVVGTERFLIALVENPDWCIDMFDHFLDMNIELFDLLWEKGYEFDSIFWPDDLGYKHNQFISIDMYRELLKPVHKRAVQWAHRKGVKAHLHSCGDISPFIPELIEIGLDALNPLEVKAGLDPLMLKKLYGKDLVLHGGINAVNWDNHDLILEEISNIIPLMKQGGGYIFSSDHSIPDSVSFSNFRDIIDLVKKIGAY